LNVIFVLITIFTLSKEKQERDTETQWKGSDWRCS